MISKKAVIESCLETVKEKLNVLKSDLSELDKSSQNETKSSMGDKYETSREIIAQERQKLQQQVQINTDHLNKLSSIDVEKVFQSVEFGSLVHTPKGNFFISSSIGQIKCNDELIFAISPLAPLAQAMLGKSEGENFSFNKQSYQIKKIK